MANTFTKSTKKALHSATKAFLFQCSFLRVLFSWSLFQYHDWSTYSPADTNPLPEIAGLMIRAYYFHWFPSRGGTWLWLCRTTPRGWEVEPPGCGFQEYWSDGSAEEWIQGTHGRAGSWPMGRQLNPPNWLRWWWFRWVWMMYGNLWWFFLNPERLVGNEMIQLYRS